MASAPLRFISHPKLLNPRNSNPHRPNPFVTNCTSNPTSEDTPPPKPSPKLPQPDRFAIVEKRRRSEIIRDRKAESGLVRPEPPNFEIGWKRTKEIKHEPPKGHVIMDFLEKLEYLMGKEYGSAELLAKTGEIVAERAREEAEVLRDGGEVEERMVTELFRVLKLMEMDLAMVKAAVKEETVSERLEQAKARCRSFKIFNQGLPSMSWSFATWIPPDTGWYKFNTDGCSLGNPGRAGAGVIIRDHQAIILGVITRGMDIARAVEAEWEAVTLALEHAAPARWKLVWIETDSRVAATCFNSKSFPWKWRARIDKAVKGIEVVKVSHVCREANFAADYAAKQAAHMEQDFMFFLFK